MYAEKKKEEEDLGKQRKEKCGWELTIPRVSRSYFLQFRLHGVVTRGRYPPPPPVTYRRQQNHGACVRKRSPSRSIFPRLRARTFWHMTDLTKPREPLLSMLRTGWYVKSCWTIRYRAIESICTCVQQHWQIKPLK